MRSEKEMLDLIINTAREDDRIRAVLMNGSRVNPNAPKDLFQDYDIVYLVTDPEPFTRNFEWIQRFGELMILQTPEDMQDPPPGNVSDYSYLMQFKDGNRIDLSIFPMTSAAEKCSDSLTVVLLDKDNTIPALPPPDDKDYLPKPPTEKAFNDCCNEFWWMCPYAAKGLWRGEIIYAKQMIDVYIREQLNKMLNWYIGIKTGFQKNPGKYGKYYTRYLEPELWQLLQRTYTNAGYENNWRALILMGDLFRQVASAVAEFYGYHYPYEDDRNVSTHIRHVRVMPYDAKEF